MDKQRISNKKLSIEVNKILDENFEVSSYEYIPTHDNKLIRQDNHGKSIEVAVLFIDMKGSTLLLENHHRKIAAKIHKVFFSIVIPILNRYKARIRSYNGDSVLAFFNGTPSVSLQNAIKAAALIDYSFNDKEKGMNNLVKKYSKIDYGIGIDYGEILCTSIGSQSLNYSSDLIWVGKPVNRAVRLGEHAKKRDNRIFISERVKKKLPPRWMKHTKETDFFNSPKNYWEKDSFQYIKGKSKEYCYSTKYNDFR